MAINFPDSEIKSRLLSVAWPYLYATGLNQQWDMFAPSPNDSASYIDGFVQYADGTSSVWSAPVSSGIGSYVDDRWRKINEILADPDNSQLWRPYVEYIAGQARRDGRLPVRVTLLHRQSQSLPPGPGPDRGPWIESVVFSSEVRVLR